MKTLLLIGLFMSWIAQDKQVPSQAPPVTDVHLYGEVVPGWTHVNTPTFGRTAESFVAGCELILFGKEVPQVSEDGQLGYRIVKRSDAVLVNGIVYRKASDKPPTPVSIDPEIIQEVAVRQAALEYIYANKQQYDDSVVVAGKTYAIGNPFEMTVPDNDQVVLVTFSEDGRWIKIAYGKNAIGYPSVKPRPRSERIVIEERLDGAYQGFLSDLNPGLLVVKGGGYAYTFPLEVAADVRASLARIPTVAEFEEFDNYGLALYKPIQDGQFHWISSLIREVVGQDRR